MNILAFETSCDETALALISVDRDQDTFSIQDHVVYSQIKEHSSYGGVVPALAARLHHKKLPEMIQEFIGRNGRDIQAIAATVGPGLEPSLYAGVNQAKVLSTVLNIPFIPVNHMHGHIWSALLNNRGEGQKPNKSEYPFLAYTISGGHTEMVLVRGYNDYEIIGQTMDDAAGEAFDKVSKLLELGYPGGPILSQIAEKGNPFAIDFPRPMSKSGDGNMSFSGLKTAVLYYVQSLSEVTEHDKQDIAASFQQAVIDVLLLKLSWAIQECDIKKVVLGGGVTANTLLRERAQDWSKDNGVPVHIPSLALSTDNAQMIAVVAALDILHEVSGRSSKVNGSLLM